MFSLSLPPPVHTATIQGTVVAVYEVGCLFGALFAFYYGEAFGRRRMVYRSFALFLSSTVPRRSRLLLRLLSRLELSTDIVSFSLFFLLSLQSVLLSWSWGGSHFFPSLLVASRALVLTFFLASSASLRTLIQITAFGPQKGFLQFMIGRVICVSGDSSLDSTFL